MKKSMPAVVVMFLLTLPAICAQQTKVASKITEEMIDAIKKLPRIMDETMISREMQVGFSTNGNILRFYSIGGGTLVEVRFEGKLNGKPVEFKKEGSAVSMNGGKLSDEEIRLMGSAIDIMKSVFTRGKFEMPEMSFTIEGEGNTLRAYIKSGAAVFEGKLEGAINQNPFEFKQDAGGDIVVNDGNLSDLQTGMIEGRLNLFKSGIMVKSGAEARE